MIKVICIDNNGCERSLTKDKLYNADLIIRSYNNKDFLYFYKICNDIGYILEYNLHFNQFKELSEFREQQIKSVLYD
jgi:GTPase SAR1 family protein